MPVKSLGTDVNTVAYTGSVRRRAGRRCSAGVWHYSGDRHYWGGAAVLHTSCKLYDNVETRHLAVRSVIVRVQVILRPDA